MSKHQIDFLPIGDKTCGDSILIRFGDLTSGDPDRQFVMLIDGGYTDDWKKIVEHVRSHYGANKIDLVVSTHPDTDHINGLSGVLNNIPVERLWMHLPWEHSSDFLMARQDEFSSAKLSRKLMLSMQSSNDLALAADQKGIVPEEPFTGLSVDTDFGKITVLSPTCEYYEELLGQILDGANGSTKTADGAFNRFATLMAKGYEKVAEWADETIDIETLSNSGETSPSNASSVVMLLELPNGNKYLFTGDAGIQSLQYAHDYYKMLGHAAGELRGIQVPHHGSRKNVGPSVLDLFLGEKTGDDSVRRGKAWVSAAENCEQHGHPKKVALNAFRRRGYPVTQTGSRGFMNGEYRKGWDSTVEPHPLYDKVERDD